MKEEQITDITNRLLTDSNTVCNSEDQKRTFLQGARQMAHVLSMNDLIRVKDKNLINDPINTEIDKILAAKILKTEIK